MRTLIWIALFLNFSAAIATAEDTAAPKAAKATAEEPIEAFTTPDSSDPKFREKLNQMLQRAEKSVKLIRVQITQNQSAPFLANLYMQLGDLLSQKSNVLYYLQMEHDKNTDLKVKETKKFSPVIAAEQEAIAIYQQIVTEFPKFDKLDKVLYRLAVAQKAIDEGPAFVATAEKLIKAYPDTKEATQVRLLLGQHFYDLQDYDQALTYLNVIKESPHPFERDAARYRIGLIQIMQEKHADALHNFQLVAEDADLKDDDNPMQLNLKTKSTKNNIKREALIDSVRAYTEVYKTDADPVGYYSRVAPTEVLFQETIEKLAYRYIFLKKYNFAIKLLRTLSERTPDAQKIMNIYHQVLQMIPIAERIDVPVQEIQFILEKYNYWNTHYKLSPELAKKSAEFFETQVRELGTRSHDLAKKETDPKKRKEDYERAKQFYLLYLGFFRGDPSTIKIATNLADVYFNLGDYLESASFYLRIYADEFGRSSQKEALIQNAILALQKPSDYAFYEQLRSKGLLVKAIRSYQSFSVKKKNDPSLNFTLAKTYYEQGLYDHALDDLYQFIKRYPDAREVNSAAELILNYFNIRSDFKGLVDWSQKMLALNPKSTELRARLQDVKAKALLKRLDEQMSTQKGYDVFAQGKSYLQQALTSGDEGIRSVAYAQALGRSKAEKDIETFLSAASAMAKAEKNPPKRSALINSMSDETLSITRFYQTLKNWKNALGDAALEQKTRHQFFEKMLKLSLMLHDWNELASLSASTSWMNDISQTSRQGLTQQLGGMIDSPLVLPASLYSYYSHVANSDDEWLPLFKAQFKLPAALRRDVLQKIAARCKGSLSSPLCKWSWWPRTAAGLPQFSATVKTVPPALNQIEPTAARMNALLDELKRFQNSGDPQLDILLALAADRIYADFALFLDRTGQANPQIAAVLQQKATESRGSSQKSKGQCQSVVAAASVYTPTNRACAKGQLPSLEEALTWPKPMRIAPPTADPRSPDILEFQKTIFVSAKDWKPYFDLAELYLSKGMLFHAAATSTYGISTFAANKEEFSAVLGCAILGMGLTGEARFYLNQASELNGHKQKCLSQIRAQAREM